MTERDRNTNTPRDDSIYGLFCEKFNAVQKMTQRSPRTLFDDFCLITAATFHNINYSVGKLPMGTAYQEMNETLEREYKDTVTKYATDIIGLFSEMVAMILGAEPPYYDHLGKLYEDLELGSKSLGQCFKPMHVCDFMASVGCGSKEEFERICEEKGRFTVYDPFCGSGRTIVALTNVLKGNYGISDLEVKFYAKLIDIDHTCARMAFINMVLLGIPARVVWGNPLSQKNERAYDTPLLQIINSVDGGYSPAGTSQNDDMKAGQLDLFNL